MKFQERVSKVFMIAGLILPLFLFNPLTASGQNNSGSRYAWDQESPYFRQCVVMNFTSPSGIQTAVQAEVYDPNGTVPDTISSLRVTYPDGTTTYDFVLSDYAGSNVYYHGISGQQPPVGEYTFTVTDTEGRTATSFFYFGGGPDLPYVDLATLQASGDASGATLSWGGVAGYQGNVFYRARVFGQAGNTIWTSGLGPGTSVSIPGHILQQIGADPEPKWRVEAFDNHTYYVSYHRSVTERKRLLPADNSSPYFDFATVFHRKDSGGDWTQVEVSVIDPDGNVPSSIQTLEVYDSSNNLICSLDHADPVRQFTWDGAFSVFYAVFPGSPAAGVYRFVVRDDQGNEKTTYDYVGPFFEIPVVDHSTYQAWGDPLTPILSWAAPAGVNRPIYYRIIIEDGTGARAWGSDRITDTSIQVPAGRLQTGVSYTWYVRTNENKYYGHYNNQGRAERATLSVNPSPKPYFRWAGVHRRHDADGSFTGLSAAVIDPAGALPGSLNSLTVTTPLGSTHVLLNNGSLANGVSYDSYYGEFFLRATGPFEDGVYTFTLVKDDFTLVTHDWVGNTPEMPLVDPMTITVSGDPATPTVSWGGVSGFQGNVYYRLRVQDTAGNQIYSTSRDPVTAQTIPMGRLEAGKIYLARVEAQEHPDWVTYNSRSNTAYAWFSTEGGTMTGVSGRVLDNFGSPIPNLHVYAQAESCWGPWQAGTMTNQNGEYTLYMPAGTYVIRACATCTGLGFVDEWYNNVYNCGEALPVFVGTNQVVQGINFTLDTAAYISGYVFEEDTLAPIPNLHVYAQTYPSGLWVAGTMTDGTGFYRLNVPAGTYIVNACASCTGLPYVDAWYDDPGTPEYPEPVSPANPGDTEYVDFSLALQPFPGDMNGDRVVNLADAIVGLQLVVGLSPADVNYSADVNGDGKLGLAEVIYVLQLVAGLR